MYFCTAQCIHIYVHQCKFGSKSNLVGSHRKAKATCIQTPLQLNLMRSEGSVEKIVGSKFPRRQRQSSKVPIAPPENQISNSHSQLQLPMSSLPCRPLCTATVNLTLVGKAITEDASVYNIMNRKPTYLQQSEPNISLQFRYFSLSASLCQQSKSK